MGRAAEVTQLRGRLKRVQQAMGEWKQIALDLLTTAEIQRVQLEQECPLIADDGTLEGWAEYLVTDPDGEAWQFSKLPAFDRDGWPASAGDRPAVFGLAPRHYRVPLGPVRIWRIHRID